jgi:hypothetical protein
MPLADRQYPDFPGTSRRLVAGRRDSCTNIIKIIFQVIHLAGKLGLIYGYAWCIDVKD